MKKAGTFLVAAATLMAAAGTAVTTASAATVVRETITLSVSERGLLDDCRLGITGDLHGTEVIDYQSVEAASGFHIEGTDGGPGRIDWSDDSYTLIQSVDRFTFNAVGQAVVSSVAHVDSGNTYAADGTFLFRSTFHEVEHFTVANGVLRVDIERGHFHGGC